MFGHCLFLKASGCMSIFMEQLKDACNEKNRDLYSFGISLKIKAVWINNLILEIADKDVFPFVTQLQ